MRPRLVLPACAVLGIGAGVATAIARDDDPAPKPIPIARCVQLWNAHPGAAEATALVRFGSRWGAVVTRDADGRCVVAFDASQCGGPKHHALAYVHDGVTWRRYRARRELRIWIRRVRRRPNAHLEPTTAKLALGRPRRPRLEDLVPQIPVDPEMRRRIADYL